MARGARVKIILACQTCSHRNYHFDKNKKIHPDRMELKKYCPFCRSHTQHKETR
jgi:large subunit ribosomal protein L33